MDLDELVPSKSKYLAKEDAGKQGLNLTIRGFKIEPIRTDNGDEDRAIMYFEEDVKPMVLNKSNKNRLKAIFNATDSSEVKGKKINVYNDPLIEFGGKIVGGLRIREEQSSNTKSSNRDPDDDIPFD